ncbi:MULTISPECIES: NAD-dependent epimerase [Chromohalobacter]|uniref:NAD-dependent epimerase n=1 Tax=Chromohalobacter TaxID=42054 RepID=UPI00054E934B|nr:MULTISPECIES: NAD-dependent epimerase [Chromohalobacter]MDF9435231.1 NAD-dependent epimerase [Chromohalobacter israelensis]NQY44277.1 NAD-dependent epimerase [Chromohalobacter sp.]NWO57392.1 NAD-dependent epimerase [Chromohalobacter salexigens]RXE48218.1 NAD-dependent epimerase [Chromohalobacter salexigens]
MNILITGMAGFIGHAVAKRLAAEGHDIVGIDNLNDYYDVSLKQARLDDLAGWPNVRFECLDLADRAGMERLFADTRFERVIHLAAQAGVRYSLDNPHVYAQSNLVGHLNVLEGCRHQQVPHLIYASSSSVYGQNAQVPFSTADAVDHPISLYAATKKANELMTHSYSHLYGIPATGLRFFTVYGPWGRPDMAMFKFTRAILADEPLPVFNHGDLSRDFTYIDDIVEGVVRIMQAIPEADPDSPGARPDQSTAPFALYNIGHGSPVALMDFVHALERATGRTARCDFKPMQPGDVPRTWADTDALFEKVGYRPQVGVDEGVARFVEWYRSFHGI